MRPVVSLLARRTLDAIRASLKATGEARCELGELRVDADEWRALARRAARELGRSVETIEGAGQVFAALRDWPQNDEERAVTLARLRQAMEAVKGPGGPQE